MQFKQYDNGSCDIEFSKEEIEILSKKGKLHLSDEALRHFGNVIMSIVVEWQGKFKKDVAEKVTYTSTKIDGQ